MHIHLQEEKQHTVSPNVGLSRIETEKNSPLFGIQQYGLEDQEPLFILDTTLNFPVEDLLSESIRVDKH